MHLPNIFLHWTDHYLMDVHYSLKKDLIEQKPTRSLGFIRNDSFLVPDYKFSLQTRHFGRGPNCQDLYISTIINCTKSTTYSILSMCYFHKRTSLVTFHYPIGGAETYRGKVVILGEEDPYELCVTCKT